ncbi:hypothetical protein M2251_000193 [Rhodococcus erythropolis]|nr:hypothetical protein [Rhodococcus erythropolis]
MAVPPLHAKSGIGRGNAPHHAPLIICRAVRDSRSDALGPRPRSWSGPRVRYRLHAPERERAGQGRSGAVVSCRRTDGCGLARNPISAPTVNDSAKSSYPPQPSRLVEEAIRSEPDLVLSAHHGSGCSAPVHSAQNSPHHGDTVRLRQSFRSDMRGQLFGLCSPLPLVTPAKRAVPRRVGVIQGSLPPLAITLIAFPLALSTQVAPRMIQVGFVTPAVSHVPTTSLEFDVCRLCRCPVSVAR